MKVYLITNLINNKQYVGQTSMTIEKRFYYHCRNNQNSLISKAINKYGKENFKLEELESTNCQNTLNYLECYYIKQLSTHVFNGGYNLTEGGENPPKATKESSFKGSLKRYKPVIATNLITGEQTWYLSIKCATFDGFKKVDISFCCRFPNKRQSHAGYKWEFVDKKHVTSYEGHKIRKSTKGQKRSLEFRKQVSKRTMRQFYGQEFLVKSINLITKEEQVFDSVISASEQLSIHRNSISDCLNKRLEKAGNYKFYHIFQGAV